MNDGGPAFPHVAELSGDFGSGGIVTRQLTGNGMSMRDYFAGQALAGMLARELPANSCELVGDPLDFDKPSHLRAIADDAYAVADAMLAERAKGGDRE